MGRVHAVVNMTSRELQEWLSTQAAGETEELPTAPGRTGRRVLEILGRAHRPHRGRHRRHAPRLRGRPLPATRTWSRPAAPTGATV
ncbi:DUF3140 domain-containing protein [Streptomyces somaliensis]|uniref:DUF3140 domain-containing protein n=1 Tax=Streptomyces somaliensis TaxID=78355 RepID=UPI0034E97A97